jgi:hypothetical protein
MHPFPAARHLLIVALPVFIGGPSWGADAAAPPADEAPANSWFERLADAGQLDTWHEVVDDGIIGAVERIDRLLGDERLDDDARQTRLRLRFGLRYDEIDAWSLLSNVRIRLALPRLEHRLQLIMNSDSEADETDLGAILGDDARDSTFDAAVRFLFSEDARHRISFDAGLRGTGPVQAFGRARGRLIVPHAKWELRLTQTFAWYTSDGFVATSEMRWTRPLIEKWWFRSVSTLHWGQKPSGVTPRQGFIVARELSDRRAYRVEVSGIWPETPHPHTTRYAAEFTYRQLVYKKWLYVEVAPIVDFRREWNYKTNPGISLRFEVLFGDEHLDNLDIIER